MIGRLGDILGQMSAGIERWSLLSNIVGLVDLLAMNVCETKAWICGLGFLVKFSAVCSYLAYFGAVFQFLDPLTPLSLPPTSSLHPYIRPHLPHSGPLQLHGLKSIFCVSLLQVVLGSPPYLFPSASPEQTYLATSLGWIKKANKLLTANLCFFPRGGKEGAS